MYQITNPEYSILVTLLERGQASGYEINRIVEARGFREWADIGKTSVYSALKKLENKGLVEGRLNRSKTGKGPVGRNFIVTDTGASLFLEETKSALSMSRERERYFALGMAGSFVLSRTILKDLLEQRVAMLKSEYERISGRASTEERMTFEAQLLFEYTYSRILAEVSFTEKVIAKLLGERNDH
jgi:DNA-binding PadR family transcriptional regulator